MSWRPAFTRFVRMGADERRFRAAVEIRKVAGRARHTFRRPRWNRRDLARVLAPGRVAGADAAIRGGDIIAAHQALAAHFSSRRSAWPIAAARREALAASIAGSFPTAADDAGSLGDRLVAGRFDLLGYEDLDYGPLPDWHLDRVHERRAAPAFWSTIPYLDAACGDHKIIWELNRHQHWLALGRAWWLTGRGRYRQTVIAQLEHWLDANRPLDGVNWASMLELGFRCLSWTYAIEFFSENADGDRNPWLVDLLIALDRQLTHIEQNLSRYFSPNTHLTGEALALYAVSLALPELRASAHRTQVGRDVLVTEASRQVLPDGGHAERSAHYHRYSTDFYLFAAMVARRSGDPAAPALEAAARAQAEYLRTIADDSGQLPLLGDDDGGQLFAFGVARPANAAPTLRAAAVLFDDSRLVSGRPSELTAWIVGRAGDTAPAASGAWPSRWLRDSGYFVSRAGGGHLVFDAGPHGFLNGGHAHADALAVTLSINGHQVLVDPGTLTYTMDPQARDRFRSPKMHNTGVLDGQASALPRGPFHWSATADARFTSVELGEGWDFAQGTYDGGTTARHVRSVFVLPPLGWLVVDQVTGDGEHELETWWHLHPDLHIDGAPAAGSIRLGDRAGRSIWFSSSAGVVAPLERHSHAVHAPEYGRLEPSVALRVTRSASAPFAMATLLAAPSHAPGRVAVDELGLDAAPPSGYHGCAFALTLGVERVVVLVAAPLNGLAAPWVARGPWGCGDVETDGRAAAVALTGNRARPLAIVEGTRVASAVHS